MDWLLDRRDAASVDRTLEGLGDYLRRHAALGADVDNALAPVRGLLKGEPEDPDEALLWVDVDWRAEKPRVTVTRVAETPDMGELSTGAALVPGTVDALAGTDRRLLDEATLDVDRRLQETFADGPPPMPVVAADPRQQGASSVGVALMAAAKAHPSANPEQLAALAGAVLADNVTDDAPPTSGPQVAALLAHAHESLGGEVRVIAADDESVEVVFPRCPFAPGVADADALCHVSTALAGRLGARVNGASTVVLSESIAAGDRACHLHVRLDDATEDLRGEVHRWPPAMAGTTRSAPHLELSVNLPSETESVPVVRRLAAQALRSFGVTDRDVGDVEVAIGEACANVIDHAISSDTYEVQVELAADQCTITVVDQGGGFDATAVPRNPDPRSEGGRGLALMRALTDNVAFRNEPQAGTVVHMTKRLEHDETHPLWSRPTTSGGKRRRRRRAPGAPQ